MVTKHTIVRSEKEMQIYPRLFFSARWVTGERKRLDEFQRKEAMSLYLDGEGNLAYLAGSQWRLDNTMENWKDLAFHATREHG